ncbi:FAD-dependent oxidoreductase [Thalassotalea sp. HSM 43]|uniref:FAD-dependent oxidoreductase n=1 Tax=Thalassotalea sp. HSM 43 TaxID=2552945 RepID=UPI001E2AFC65|nr:FAD-dependent oxidoreductase [Thalassotalea sp. HSM 43]
MVEVKRVQVATKVQSSEPAEYKAEKPSAPVRVDSSRQPVVIIGSGLAGYNLAKEIRKSDKQVPISVFTADDGAFYSKPMLSTGFAKNKTAADLASHSAEQMAEQYDLDVHIYTRISAIDSDNKTITCDDDKAYNYGKLVFATGARCIQAPVSGNGLSHVYSVNDLLDYNRFRTLAKSKRKVLIIGAGLIGCEYANDLLQSGFEVNVVDAMPTALANLLPEQASQSLVNAMTDAGAAFHFDTVVETISKQDNGVLATLSNGNSIAADIVLSAIGVRPNLGLATTTGLEVNRGIKTDRHMQTSVADIYAVGDCAEVEGHVLFYIAPLMAQVKALAATLTGTPTKVHYPAMPVAIKTTLFPVVVNPPQAGADGQWHDKINSNTGVQSHFVDAQGQLLGFALTGDQVSQRAELETQCPALLS